jgi:hypothetical protein
MKRWCGSRRGSLKNLVLERDAFGIVSSTQLLAASTFARRDGVTTGVYPIRGEQYQFCNCGVSESHACRFSICIDLTLGTTEGNYMAKKAKKAKKKKSAKKKKK